MSAMTRSRSVSVGKAAAASPFSLFAVSKTEILTESLSFHITTSFDRRRRVDARFVDRQRGGAITLLAIATGDKRGRGA